MLLSMSLFLEKELKFQAICFVGSCVGFDLCHPSFGNQRILNFEVMAVRDITYDRVCRKIYTYLVIFSHFRSLSIRKSAFVNIFWFGSENQSAK